MLKSMLAYTILFSIALVGQPVVAQDCLHPLKDGKAPTNLQELWSGFDPRKEPINAKAVKEWEQEGVICRLVLYRIGTFKGIPSTMLGIYGFPKGGHHLPGLVQMHGGGQSANLNAVTTNAKRGYACISINWGGNPIAVPGGYEGPNTDWGAIDATQNSHNNHYVSLEPDEFTVDSVRSGRNNNWFLLTLAARRALTFLEQQPEVDGSRLGVYGHSMGGNLSLYVPAVDERVKAAVPSCGGGTGDGSDNIKNTPFSNGAYASHFKCPVLFLNPANDHHGSIEGIERTVNLMPSEHYRYSRAPQLGHRDTAEHLVCGPLWFDQWLKGTFTFPKTPEITLDLDAPDGIPICKVNPESATAPFSVEIYYTQHGEDKISGKGPPCWRYVQPVRDGSTWSARVPLFTAEKPIWIYANVIYPLDKSVTGAGYYYGIYTTDKFSVTSKMLQVPADSLHQAHVKVTDKTSLLIEPFDAGWQKGWYSFEQDGGWPYRTNKFRDPKWTYPTGAKLALGITAPRPLLIQVTIDGFMFSFECSPDRPGTVIMSPSDFKREDQILPDFSKIHELTLDFSYHPHRKESRLSRGDPEPVFKNLRWKL